MESRGPTVTAVIPLMFALALGCFAPSSAHAEPLDNRRATVIRLQSDTIANIRYQWVYLRIEAKARTRKAESFEARLDTTSTKIILISPTGRKRETTRDALKPNMRILVSGWTSISGVPTATEIRIPEAKP